MTVWACARIYVGVRVHVGAGVRVRAHVCGCGCVRASAFARRSWKAMFNVTTKEAAEKEMRKVHKKIKINK